MYHSEDLFLSLFRSWRDRGAQLMESLLVWEYGTHLVTMTKIDVLLLAGGKMPKLITVRNNSCGKVMFSQVYVKNSVHGGEVYTPPGQTPPTP